MTPSVDAAVVPTVTKRFTTYERIELSMPVIVKKNGSRSEYESGKATRELDVGTPENARYPLKRSTPPFKAYRRKLLNSGQREVVSGHLGELVMRELKRPDKVAYIRFGVCVQELRKTSRFVEAIQEVKKIRPRAFAGPEVTH